MLEKTIKIFVISILCLHGTTHVFSRGNVIEDQFTEGLFNSTTPLELLLYADFELLKSNRNKTVPYQKHRLCYLNDKNDSVHVLTQIRVRGNYRLRESTCSFPPLKLKFRARDIDSTIFEGNDKLKLVTHCQDDNVEMHNSVMREYLAYQIYNQVCDYSLKVRLVNVTYIDVNTGYEIQQKGFFIEDVEDMCRRLQMEEFESLNLLMEQLNQKNMVLMSMFQFMIGNNDWSVPKLHNVVVMREGTHVPPVAVPYDFDMSSFVDPPYRKTILGENEPDVEYKGHRIELDQLNDFIVLFKDKRGSIIDLILDFPYLDVASKQDCLNRLEYFYDILDHRSAIRRRFVSKSRS